MSPPIYKVILQQIYLLCNNKKSYVDINTDEDHDFPYIFYSQRVAADNSQIQKKTMRQAGLFRNVPKLSNNGLFPKHKFWGRESSLKIFDYLTISNVCNDQWGSVDDKL